MNKTPIISITIEEGLVQNVLSNQEAIVAVEFLGGADNEAEHFIYHNDGRKRQSLPVEKEAAIRELLNKKEDS